jgi:hypothetical protein
MYAFGIRTDPWICIDNNFLHYYRAFRSECNLSSCLPMKGQLVLTEPYTGWKNEPSTTDDNL